MLVTLYPFNKHATPTALVFDAIINAIGMTCLWHLRYISCLRHLTPMGWIAVTGVFTCHIMELSFKPNNPVGVSLFSQIWCPAIQPCRGVTSLGDSVSGYPTPEGCHYSSRYWYPVIQPQRGVTILADLVSGYPTPEGCHYSSRFGIRLSNPRGVSLF
jgi:hypothetical protein